MTMSSNIGVYGILPLILWPLPFDHVFHWMELKYWTLWKANKRPKASQTISSGIKYECIEYEWRLTSETSSTNVRCHWLMQYCVCVDRICRTLWTRPKSPTSWVCTRCATVTGTFRRRAPLRATDSTRASTGFQISWRIKNNLDTIFNSFNYYY